MVQTMNNPVLAQQEEFSDYFEKIGSSVNNVVSTTDNEVGIGESLKEAVLTIDKSHCSDTCLSMASNQRTKTPFNRI